VRPIPPHIAEFLSRPNPAVVATLKPDGSPHTAVTWYGWEDGRLFITMDAIRRRVDWLRADARVSLTVLDEQSWYRHVTLMGRVVSLEPDVALADYDRLILRYRGRRSPDRDRERVTAWIEVDRWYSWDAAVSSADSTTAPLR
jgi:PPOX class probable F420-dependent enzyme